MRRLAGIVLAAALLSGAAACGGGDDKKSGDNQVATEFGTAKPEDVRASAAEVADGLAQLGSYADEVVAKLGSDDAGATETQERLLTIWESILGTVKANDPSAYDKIDAALTTLMGVKGSAGKSDAQPAATTVRQTAADYLARYPGDATTAPGSSASPATDSGTSGPAGSGADDVPSDSDSGGGMGY